jgi:hypothetical protein
MVEGETHFQALVHGHSRAVLRGVKQRVVWSRVWLGFHFTLTAEFTTTTYYTALFSLFTMG